MVVLKKWAVAGHGDGTGSFGPVWAHFMCSSSRGSCTCSLVVNSFLEAKKKKHTYDSRHICVSSPHVRRSWTNHRLSSPVSGDVVVVALWVVSPISMLQTNVQVETVE